jgi:hypothetical protein
MTVLDATPYIIAALMILNAWLLWRASEQKRDRAADRADLDRIAASLSDFKLQVTREYVTQGAIREVELRLVAAIDRLGDRLDKWVDNCE